MARQMKDFKISASKMLGTLSLTEKDFNILLPFFEDSYQYYFKRFTITGKVRERYLSSNGNNKLFTTPADALFFILFYVKTYPTEESMAMIFCMTQIMNYKKSFIAVKKSSCSGVKRLHILKHKLRMKKYEQHDLVMLLGCGLHNFRCANREN